MLNKLKNSEEVVQDNGPSNASRRAFLTKAGTFSLFSAFVLTSGLTTACKTDSTNPPVGGTNLGSGDIGILNYAYALEQLEAAFYTRVIASPYAGITASEMALLADIRDHEIAHREFFKNALGSSAIQSLDVNFTSINFTNRASVLSTAKAFEDLGVSAYNGAGQLISDVNYLALAGKIVSVEARHAALIRDLITPGTFANDLDSNALDISKLPPAVLAIAGTYINTTLDASHLPT